MTECDHLPSKLIIFICIFLAPFFMLSAQGSQFWTLNTLFTFQTSKLLRPPNCYHHLNPTQLCSILILPQSQLLQTSLGMSLGEVSGQSLSLEPQECWSVLAAWSCAEHIGRAAAAQRGEAPGRHVTMSQLLWAGLFWKYEYYICYHWGFSYCVASTAFRP